MKECAVRCFYPEKNPYSATDCFTRFNRCRLCVACC